MLERKEEVEIGELMKAYNTKGELLEFRLRESKSKYVGQTLDNFGGGSFTVLGNLDKEVNKGKFSYFLIEFIDETRLIISIPVLSSIDHKRVTNPNESSVLNIGVHGQGKYSSSKNTKEYQTWCRMLERCYSIKEQERYNTYKDCSVTKRWYNFQNFCEDILSLDGYKEWKDNTIPRRYELDKDIKIDGNKVYSKDTCMFVTHTDNSIKACSTRWKKELTTRYLATNIETGEEYIFYNQARFAEDHNLNRRAIGKCLRGERNKHKGYTFKVLD